MTDYHMREHEVTMRKMELSERSRRRMVLLRQMENCMAQDGEELPPKEVEAKAMLALGQQESRYRSGLVTAAFEDLRRKFNEQPWWKRVWQAWRKGL